MASAAAGWVVELGKDSGILDLHEKQNYKIHNFFES